MELYDGDDPVVTDTVYRNMYVDDLIVSWHRRRCNRLG